MRNGFVVVASLLLMAGVIVAFSTSRQSNSEEAAVRETVQHYLNGLKHNDVESLKRAFYPEAKLFFVRLSTRSTLLSPSKSRPPLRFTF